MKKSFFKVLPVLFGLLVFFGCKQDVALDSEEEHEANKPEVSAPAEQPAEDSNDAEESVLNDINPTYNSSRAKSLDFIFNNQTLGKTTVTIKRSEWNKMCDDYRYFFKNENCVQAEKYEYEKDGSKWVFNKGIGFRLRGNTSRYCPQGYDNGNIQGQMNSDWNSEYYTYANSQPLRGGDYRQTHFKVDFEEFLADGESRKMSGCMKGVALKRLDNLCGKEIFCYDLFRKNGIWTAPRASHTRLIIKIIESDNTTTTVDYGVYEMFEEINKQSLKARDVDETSVSNAWKNSKGNLWKCGGGSSLTDSSGIGIEDIRIIYANDNRPSNMQTNGREDSTRVGYVWNQYSMDLKTNKDSFTSAQSEFTGFIQELNALSDSDVTSIKNFYNKWFDMDLFLKTYAINILCGMDDDYWGNANNYYLYFDTDAKGSGKVYFIPFDYDNTLGSSINSDKEGFKHNPLEWGRGANRPLIDKLLLVPEFKEKFIDYLLEVSDNQYWNFERCSGIFNSWGAMCGSYMKSKDLNFYKLGADSFDNYGGTWNPEGYSLLNSGNNVFEYTTYYFKKNLGGGCF